MIKNMSNSSIVHMLLLYR